jgi:hypothetical protein
MNTQDPRCARCRKASRSACPDTGCEVDLTAEAEDLLAEVSSHIEAAGQQIAAILAGGDADLRTALDRLADAWEGVAALQMSSADAPVPYWPTASGWRVTG